MRIDTILARVGLGADEATGAVSAPIHPSATFVHPGLGETTGFDYSRTANPTRRTAEVALAALEEGFAGFCFSSGMAALTTLFLLFEPGDHLLVSDDLYGGTYRALEGVFRRFGLMSTYADLSRSEDVDGLVQARTRAILVETPTNPLMKVIDISALGKLAADRDLMLIVDNTFLTPYYQRPLALGAHVVAHSATKYLGGHNDLLAGVLVARDEELAGRLAFLQNTTGAVLSPQDSWLLLRSLKTLGVRLERQSAGARRIAEFLRTHPAVRAVYYPGFPDHPGHATMLRQASGFGGMLSFRLSRPGRMKAFLRGLCLICFAESLGGVESLVTVPSRQTHADMPPALRESLGITDDLVRLSVGLESLDDLLEDLENALAQVL